MQPRADGTGTISQAGGLLLSETVRATGLDTALRTALARWRKPGAVHDPAKTCTDWPSRSPWAATAWPMPNCCGPNPP
ncbi:hypothetical protein LP52_15705 [Streptomonospora alba]|uniref:Transposase DDE domain-containing protein n=1 Tax=Streptomonospora alba TaxID=183763 RepID=A0A0C2FFT8_9ACTN|nr:hypothetical protein LP52_15705 [Streptomonospora alba]